MNREEAISIIDELYPADSGYEETAKIGRELLDQAKRSAWRTEPTEVLIKYAQLCIKKERGW